MNTSTISNALPVTPSNSGGLQTGASPEADASSSPFSSVLTRQKTAETRTESTRPTHGGPTPQNSDSPQLVSDASEDTDEALAESVAEHGLSLPQIALSIAAEAALAMAARQPGAAGAAPANGATLTAALSTTAAENAEALAAALTNGKLHAAPIDAEHTITSAAALAAATKNGATSKAMEPELALDTPAATSGKRIEIPTGFIPVQASALPHQTELNLRKAPGLAGNTGKNLLAAQTPATDFTIAKTATLDATALAADIAAASAKASFANVSAQHDLSASQAGSLTTAAGTAASTTMLSGNMGSMANTGAQPALPGIATPLQSPQWGAEFGRQFVSLTQGGHNMPHTAELRLDPPELGPLRISINISDNVAHAVFTSPHAAVRQTVENSLPQLQQLLAQAGISLGQTSVSDQGQTDQSFNESFGASRKTTAANTDGAIGSTAGPASGPAARSRAPDALVDTFA